MGSGWASFTQAREVGPLVSRGSAVNGAVPGMATCLTADQADAGQEIFPFILLPRLFYTTSTLGADLCACKADAFLSSKEFRSTQRNS
jgi:hypothetical protein